MGNIQNLAVGGDPIIRKMLEVTLGSEDRQVILAANGSEAIAALNN